MFFIQDNIKKELLYSDSKQSIVLNLETLNHELVNTTKKEIKKNFKKIKGIESPLNQKEKDDIVEEYLPGRIQELRCKRPMISAEEYKKIMETLQGSQQDSTNEVKGDLSMLPSNIQEKIKEQINKKENE